MSALTGKALKDRATELNVTGRSKMNADELRAAIRDIERADQMARNNTQKRTLGSATPMTSERRMDVYMAKGKVTPKMARRARKAENKARG
jgi:NADH:ubiquinone oxidoreductase subunit B-like Fe-S oxidoreductase